jgi:hypothetical protein
MFLAGRHCRCAQVRLAPAFRAGWSGLRTCEIRANAGPMSVLQGHADCEVLGCKRVAVQSTPKFGTRSLGYADKAIAADQATYACPSLLSCLRAESTQYARRWQREMGRSLQHRAPAQSATIGPVRGVSIRRSSFVPRYYNETPSRACRTLPRVAGDLDAPDVGRRQAEDVPQLLRGVGDRQGVDARQSVRSSEISRRLPCATPERAFRVQDGKCSWRGDPPSRAPTAVGSCSQPTAATSWGVQGQLKARMRSRIASWH